MIKKIVILIIILISITGTFASAFGQKEAKGMEKITGIPTVYGTEPHTYVCIETETGKIFYVHPDNQQEIRGLDRYRYIFTVKFMEGGPVSFDASFHKDGTVKVIAWKKQP